MYVCLLLILSNKLDLNQETRFTILLSKRCLDFLVFRSSVLIWLASLVSSFESAYWRSCLRCSGSVWVPLRVVSCEWICFSWLSVVWFWKASFSSVSFTLCRFPLLFQNVVQGAGFRKNCCTPVWRKRCCQDWIEFITDDILVTHY